MAKNSLPSRSSKAIPFRPATLSTLSSKTANSSATKLSPKFAPSPPPMTTSRVSPGQSDESAARRFQSVFRSRTRLAFYENIRGCEYRSTAAQLEALNFSRHRFRQLAAKAHFTRHFVRDEPCLDVLANLRRQFLRPFEPSAQDNISHGVSQPLPIDRGNHGGFRYVRMAQKGILHFHRRNPHSSHLQHVVRAPAVV